MNRQTLLLTAVFIVSSCSEVTEPEVDWSKYGPALQGVVMNAVTKRDCAGMQAEFDNGIDMNMKFISRGEKGTSDLTNFLDNKMREAGCY